MHSPGRRMISRTSLSSKDTETMVLLTVVATPPVSVYRLTGIWPWSMKVTASKLNVALLTGVAKRRRSSFFSRLSPNDSSSTTIPVRKRE